MKKLIFILCILMSQFVIAQIDSCTVQGRFSSFFAWSELQEKYIVNGEDWMYTKFTFTDDYYTVELDDNTFTTYWRYIGEGKSGEPMYLTENEEKVVFFNGIKKIAFFYTWEAEKNRYVKVCIISKTSLIK